MQFETYIYLFNKQKEDEVETSVSVTCDIDVVTDAYATGDSPEQFEIKNIVIEHDGENITKYIDNGTMEYIEEDAINYYVDYYKDQVFI